MGELARQPGCPQLAVSPLELLTPRPNEDYPLYNKWAWPLSGIGIGLTCSIFYNVVQQRPRWAGIHRHIIMAGGLAYLLTYLRDIKYAARAETDEIYKHYITLHPEDYPPYERKRFSEVYKPFSPIR